MPYLARRLGFYLAALAVAITINFFLPRLLPGDPAATILGTSAGKLTQDDLQRVRDALGLSDAPLIEQYGTYSSSNMAPTLCVSRRATSGSHIRTSRRL